MRPIHTTPAHQTDGLAELVCSNSLKGRALTSPHGLLKAELKKLGSRLLDLAEKCAVPAGESLAVDRAAFSNLVTSTITSHPNITLIREEKIAPDPDVYTILAPGPLASSALCEWIQKQTGQDRLAFFDSIAPVVSTDSLDFNYVYAKNRWDKGSEPDFLNCPLSEEQYKLFVDGLVNADTVEPKPFEKGQLFEGCLPIEEMARRGPETLRFGPMRPVGLIDPVSGIRPYAVLQLRAENPQKSLYNLVGCQTRLKWGTQQELFRIIPALREAEFVRLGAMHRNSFVQSPIVCTPHLQLKNLPIFLAGQFTGAEGYTEAIATGLHAASQVLSQIKNNKPLDWPIHTCIGTLVKHLTTENPDFQPMNFNFGLLPNPSAPYTKKTKKDRQIEEWEKAVDGFNPLPVTNIE